MKKTIFVLSTVAVVGLGSAFFGDSVQADTINELENKQTEIKSERLDVKANLSKADAEIADILFDLKEINADINRVGSALEENKTMMKEVKGDISNTEEEIDLLESEIEELEENIEVRFEKLKERAKSYQRTGGDIGYLEVLVGSKTFGEFVSRASAVSKITNSDADLMEKQEEDKAEVEKKQEKHEVKLAEQEEMIAEFEEIDGIVTEQQDKNEQDKKDLTKKEEELKTLKAELENKDSSLVALEAEIRNEIESSRNPVVSSSESSSDQSSEANSEPSSESGSEPKSKDNLKTLSKESSTPAPAVGSGMGSVVSAGNKFIGNSSYVYGAADPAGARFDCSGFVNWAFSQGGYSVPRSTGELVNSGTAVSSSDMQPGDLVFFNTNGHNGHVGIYIGGGNFIGSQSSTGVAIKSLTSGYWEGQFSGTVRRIN